MIFTTKELIKKGESKYSIRTKVSNGTLYLVERGIYSDDPLFEIDEVYASKKYPEAILTGLSAFYLYDLTDQIPDNFYFATQQHSFPIRKDGFVQSYQDESFFRVGAVVKKIGSGDVVTYDLERMLIELFRLKEKYPKDLYFEVLESFRKIKSELDFYKINCYLKCFSNGRTLLARIKESI